MIPQDFADAFERIKELVSIFSQNEERYLSPGYSEAQARLDFIDKFWIALGWDVGHENQTDPYKQEVKVERGVATNEWRKRSDYAFLSSNFRDVRFYVEAKKPHAGIDNPDFYFQTIRYGWNSHTPIAVLTDFEELRVLDCRYKPDIRTAIGHAVLKYHYTDYSDERKFRTIYYLFSRESVLEGSIENFAKGLPKLSRKRALRGAAKDEHQDIDEAFLKELDEYREELARAFKRKNPELESEALTEVTQRTLDRLVFMRFLEDKLIETEPLIEKLHQRGNAWQNFVAASRRLDRVYNGIIFKEHSLLDSPGFTTDGRTFDKITRNLSHTNSPYDFNAIPIHILGSIYERFLGKVIVATDKRARVEEKPEVRKAGGVYYTPEYIVRYIVDNTVGKLIEGKKPEEIRQMRFADIACGSGSFLLGVYDTLLRYHTGYYNRNKRTQNEGRKAGCLPTETGAMRLSLLQKRTILLNNIYGVDIDAQAVEVAQLSLYLKLLEDETTASAHQQQMALREALLPSLNKNIVSGNSLIGWDILEGKLFDSGEERKLNPMNFDDAFPEVMKRGGFDAIVGNPPYIRIQTLRDTTPESVEYFSRHYAAASKGNYDIYVVFVERAMGLLSEQGKLGYILPHKFFNAKYGEPLRRLLSERQQLSHIVHFGDAQVFKGATTYTNLLFADRPAQAEMRFVRVNDLSRWQETLAGDEGTIPSSSISSQEWNFSMGESGALFEKLNGMPTRLGDVAQRIYQGVITSADPVFLFKEFQIKGQLTQVSSQLLEKSVTLETQILKRVVRSGGIKRYAAEPEALVLFPYDVIDNSARLFSKDELENRFPLAWQYLCTNRKVLESRERGKFSDAQWYRFGRSQNLGLWEQPKLLVPYMISELAAYPDQKDNYYFVNVTTGGYGITIAQNAVTPYYLCGLLNSQLLDRYLKHISTNFRGGYFAANKQYIERLPIPVPDLSDKADSARHDRIVQLVTQMLEAKEQLASAETERDKTFYENKCAMVDRQIDNLVYELYDLTPEEIAIVEEGSK